MKTNVILMVALFLVLAVCTAPGQAPQVSAGREKLLMDFGWRFALGHAYDTEEGFRQRERVLLLFCEDRLWRRSRCKGF